MNKQEIEQWLKDYRITNYTIHPNLVVDVNGHVNVSNSELEFFPFQFGKVTGRFACHNNKLTSLKNSPKTVGGMFDCSHNKLTSLQYLPLSVGGLYCSYNDYEEVTRENEGSWIRAIKLDKGTYSIIRSKATSHMTTVFELRWKE